MATPNGVTAERGGWSLENHGPGIKTPAKAEGDSGRIEVSSRADYHSGPSVDPVDGCPKPELPGFAARSSAASISTCALVDRGAALK
jgi:hypothetical protein